MVLKGEFMSLPISIIRHRVLMCLLLNCQGLLLLHHACLLKGHVKHLISRHLIWSCHDGAISQARRRRNTAIVRDRHIGLRFKVIGLLLVLVILSHGEVDHSRFVALAFLATAGSRSGRSSHSQ